LEEADKINDAQRKEQQRRNDKQGPTKDLLAAKYEKKK